MTTNILLTLWNLVRGEGHGGGNKGEKGNKLEGLHGELLCYYYALCGVQALFPVDRRQSVRE